MDHIQFDQLPHLCLQKVFSFLNCRDLVRCRPVNRLFKWYADEAPVNDERLVVSDEAAECRQRCKTWYRTRRPFDHESSLSRKAFASLKSSPFKLNKQLKFLHLHLGCDYDPTLSAFVKLLNDFEQLIQLELNVKSYIRVPTTLILPNLKVFYVRGCSKVYHLKTPKLEVLTCGEISQMQVEHPETIKQLKCDYCVNPNSMSIFKNVQVLDLYCTNTDFDEITLTNWNELKELHLSISSHDQLIRRENSWGDCAGTVYDVLHQKAELKREELKVYLEDVLVVGDKQLPDYDLPLELFWVKNWKLLRCNYDLTELPFNEFMEMSVEQSNEFLKRFPRFRRITATGSLIARDRFEWLLQNALEVRELWLTNTGLDQAAMEHLLQINGRLTDLRLKKCQINNFDFVLQFEQLQRFKTDQEFDSLNWPAKVFGKLKQLEIFHFRTNNAPVEIHRYAKDKYSLTVQRDYKWGLKWDELVYLYDQKRAAPIASLSSSESDSD